MGARTALVVGTVGLDLVAATHDAATAHAAAGNSGSNIAVRLAAAGWQVSFVTLTGDDDAATIVREDCARWGVDTSGFVVDPDYRTPREFIVSDGRGASDLVFACPGCGSLRDAPLRLPEPEQLSAATLETADRADLVIVDIAAPAAVAVARRTATRTAPGTIWYEASLYEASPVDQQAVAAWADVVKCSAEELGHYAGLMADPPARVGLTLITGGAAPSRIRLRTGTGWQELEQSTTPISPVDTLGAGDAFTAACAAALATGSADRGPEPEERRGRHWSASAVQAAVSAGASAAARTCLAVGARGDLGIDPAGAAVSPWVCTDVPFRCSTCTPDLRTSPAPPRSQGTQSQESPRWS